jgi:hypothetical protein
MRRNPLYFHSLVYVFIALFLIASPINSYAENPLTILRDKLQESLLNTLNTAVTDAVDSESGNDIESDFKSVVPSLIGKTPNDAEQLLKSHNLILGKVVDKESTQPAGKILSQSHGVNSEVQQNTAINIEVAIAVKTTQQASKPEAPPPVKPAVKTQKFAITLKLSRKKVAVGEAIMLQAVLQPSSAKNKKLHYNFTVDGKMIPSKIAKVLHKTTKVGKVIVTASVREGSGKWLHSKSLWLEITKAKQEVSKETKKTTSTDSSNNAASRAAATAAAAEEQVKIAEEQAAEIQSTKIAQEQAAAQAAEIAQTSEVEVKTATTTKVPDVVGLPLNEAERIFDKVNLRVGSIRSKASVGLPLILAQTPNAGATVAQDSYIDLISAIRPDFNFELSVDRTEIKQNEALTFNGMLTPTEIDAPIRYRLIINEQSQNSDQPIWTYNFTKSGTYRVIAEAIVEGDGIYRSTAITIQVSPIWQAPKAQIEPPTLMVTQGDLAIFKSLSSYDKKSSLSLYWMDESGGSSDTDEYRVNTQNWQSGEYWISLRVKDDQGFEHSDKAQLIVMADNGQAANTPFSNNKASSTNASQPQLVLSTPSDHTTAGKALPFTLKFQSIMGNNIRYRIHFGDGEVLETSRLWANHRYATLGRYSAFVETRYKQKIIRSEIINVWVWPSWFLLGVIGLGLLILAGLMKFFLYRTQTVVKTKDSHIDYIAVPDMGEQRLEIKSRASQSKTRVTFNSPDKKDQ